MIGACAGQHFRCYTCVRFLSNAPAPAGTSWPAPACWSFHPVHGIGLCGTTWFRMPAPALPAPARICLRSCPAAKSLIEATGKEDEAQEGDMEKNGKEEEQLEQLAIWAGGWQRISCIGLRSGRFWAWKEPWPKPEWLLAAEGGTA